MLSTMIWHYARRRRGGMGARNTAHSHARRERRLLMHGRRVRSGSLQAPDRLRLRLHTASLINHFDPEIDPTSNVMPGAIGKASGARLLTEITTPLSISADTTRSRLSVPGVDDAGGIAARQLAAVMASRINQRLERPSPNGEWLRVAFAAPCRRRAWSAPSSAPALE